MPPIVADAPGKLSRWMPLIAIAAVGMKIPIGQVMVVGWRAIVFATAETLFIGSIVLFGIKLVLDL